jgi:hypothetical protein
MATESTGTSWQDMETKGFLLIPQFLSTDELKILISEFNSLKPDANANYPIKVMRLTTAMLLRKKLNLAAQKIAQCTSICTNTLVGGVYFSTKMGVNFDWHQDHESFFEFQDHHNYLNFYIPLQKPASDKSNLSVIPFDELERLEPKVHALAVGQGASRLVRKGSKLMLKNENSGERIPLPEDFEKIGVTPHLYPGDLLLMRGDIIHKTQDASTDRVAVSLRMVNGQGIISKEKMLALCWPKVAYMVKNRWTYQTQLECFRTANRKELAVADYLKIFRHKIRASRDSRLSKFRFLFTLLRAYLQKSE